MNVISLLINKCLPGEVPLHLVGYNNYYHSRNGPIKREISMS